MIGEGDAHKQLQKVSGVIGAMQQGRQGGQEDGLHNGPSGAATTSVLTNRCRLHRAEVARTKDASPRCHTWWSWVGGTCPCGAEAASGGQCN